MIDAEVDAERAANSRAAEFAARRMLRRTANLSADGPTHVRRGGTLAALPSAPAAQEAGGAVASVAVPRERQPEEAAGGGEGLGGATEFLIAAALVAVLFVAWIAERRSARKVVEDGYG